MDFTAVGPWWVSTQPLAAMSALSLPQAKEAEPVTEETGVGSWSGGRGEKARRGLGRLWAQGEGGDRLEVSNNLAVRIWACLDSARLCGVHWPSSLPRHTATCRPDVIKEDASRSGVF